MAATAGRYGLDTAEDYFAVTPHDTNELAIIPRGLLIAVGGTLKVTKPNGDTCATTVPAGWFPGRCKIVWATGTSATGITAFV